jgi:hypothetical protein
MAAPIGNQNAKKAKEFEAGLRRALARDEWKRFNAGCDKVADAFADGQPWACQFVADRMDGKPAQAIVNGDDGEAFKISALVRTVVDPRNPDS